MAFQRFPVPQEAYLPPALLSQFLLASRALYGMVLRMLEPMSLVTWIFTPSRRHTRSLQLTRGSAVLTPRSAACTSVTPTSAEPAVGPSAACGLAAAGAAVTNARAGTTTDPRSMRFINARAPLFVVGGWPT